MHTRLQSARPRAPARPARARGCFVCASLLGALALAPRPALAAPPDAAPSERERAEARRLGEEALALYEKGEWAAAYDGFARADAIMHAPTLGLLMARCQRKLDKLGRARELYEEVAAADIAEGAPEQFATAKADAQRELAELVARIPSLSLYLRDAPPGARVLLDGTELDASKLGSPMAADPGDHEIRVEAPGRAAVVRHLLLHEGTNESLELAVGAAEPGSDDVSGGSLAPAAVAFALGAAGRGMGAITGGLALAKANDIESRCVDGHCPAADEAAADDARLLGTLSTAGFVIGGVGVATGVVLAIVQPGGAGDGEPAAPQAAQLTFELSPFGAVFGGRF